jgi:hypothetical protein
MRRSRTLTESPLLPPFPLNTAVTVPENIASWRVGIGMGLARSKKSPFPGEMGVLDHRHTPIAATIRTIAAAQIRMSPLFGIDGRLWARMIWSRSGVLEGLLQPFGDSAERVSSVSLMSEAALVEIHDRCSIADRAMPSSLTFTLGVIRIHAGGREESGLQGRCISRLVFFALIMKIDRGRPSSLLTHVYRSNWPKPQHPEWLKLRPRVP